MKVLDIYGKKDLDILTCGGKSLSDIMNNWFLNFPESYRVNYDKNLEDLTLWRVDDDYDNDLGVYSPKTNLLIFKDFSSLPHELQHLSSYDKKSERMAFIKDMKYPLFEMALVEGMTEYLSAQSLNKEVTDSYFECFTISMLSLIDGIFEPFYIPNHDKFISLFPDKKNIYSLMYSLDYYRQKTMDLENCSEEDIRKVRQAIRDTIDALIDIELSFDKRVIERKRYGDKCMDLLDSDDIKDTIEYIYEDYKDYAFHEIKKRVLRRI